jgi:glycerophosphoryl diester phosphodiesterase
MAKTLVAAHTGCGISPDNTMASFLEGIRIGADIVEVDVLVSRDGTAILLHDDSPYLLTHNYERLNHPEMRRRLGSAYVEHEIATLEQILRVSDSLGTKLNLDFKSAACIEPAVGLIRKYGAQKRAFITGYSDSITKRYSDIQVMMNTPVELTLQQIDQYDNFAESVCREARQGEYIGLNMNGQTCLPQVVEKAHAEGLTVWVYTVNEKQHMERFIQMGVDAITTRKPEVLIQILRKIESMKSNY